MSERDLAVATWYFLQSETMEVIARRLGVSRSTVSRILARARESGLVTITIDPSQRSTSAVEQQLHDQFGCQAYVAEVRESATQLQCLEQVAHLAVSVLLPWVDDDARIGLAWGTTVAAMVCRIPPSPRHRVQVVQLNGAANDRTTGVGYAGEILAHAARAFDGTAQHFPVPAFFDYTTTKQALWRERSVKRILAMQRNLDIAVFGVGAVRGDLPSHVYTAGYLSKRDLRSLAAEKVVGDVCTVFLRADGTYADIDLNQRASGPTPDQLARIRRRLCIVAGEAKVPALVAALRAGVVTDLVVDTRTARGALEYARARTTRTGR